MHYLFRVIIIILHVFVRIVVAVVTAACNRDLSCLSSIPYSILRLIIGIKAAYVRGRRSQQIVLLVCIPGRAILEVDFDICTL